MSNLWDREIQPLVKQLEGWGEADCLRLGVEAIEWSLRTEPERISNTEASALIAEVMGAARAAVADNAAEVPLPENMEERLDEVIENTSESGVFQLLVGIQAFFCAPGYSDAAVEAIFFDCYEFSLQRTWEPPTTAEAQEADPRISEVIAYQKQLLTDAIARRSGEPGE